MTADSLHRVDVDESLGAPRARGQRALQLSRVVIEIVVAPARTLRPPDEITAGLHVLHVLPFAGIILDVLVQQLRRRLRRQLHVDQLEVPLRAIATHHAQVIGALAVPVDVEQPLVLPLPDRRRRELGIASAVQVQLFRSDILLARHGVGVAHQLRPRTRRVVDEVQLLHLALIHPRHGERFRVGRPGHVRAHPRIAIDGSPPAATAALLHLRRSRPGSAPAA